MSSVVDELAANLQAAQSGNRDALGRALDQCREFLLHLAREELGSDLLAKGGASDLVQETFLIAQRDFAHFHGTSSSEWRGWLRCLLRRRAAQFGRRFRTTQKRRLGREVPLIEAAAGPTPSGILAADEELAALQSALARLPDDYRQIMTLRYRQGLSFEEVGRLMNRSADAARMLWSRAVERLRLELRADHELPH